jgi:hypothetical protein
MAEVHQQAPDLTPEEEAELGGRLREHLQATVGAATLPPLPEDAWVKRDPIRDEVPPETTTSDRSEASEEDAGSGSPGHAAAGSTGSTDLRASLRRNTAKLYATIAKPVIGGLSGVANLWARQEPDDPAWLMTEEEADGLAEPIANIAARRIALPLGEGETNDIIDGVQIVAVLVSYVTRNMLQRLARRRGPAAPNPMQQQEAAGGRAA